MMKRKRIKYLMRSRTLWIGCCIAAHMAIILWAIFAISKVWNAFYLVIHIVNIVLLIQICANDRLTSGYRAFWLSFMILIPIFSPFFYLIWGKYSLRAKGIEVIKERKMVLAWKRYRWNWRKPEKCDIFLKKMRIPYAAIRKLLIFHGAKNFYSIYWIICKGEKIYFSGILHY